MLVQRLFQRSFGKCTFSTPSTYALKIRQSVEERYNGHRRQAHIPRKKFMVNEWVEKKKLCLHQITPNPPPHLRNKMVVPLQK